MRRRTVRIAAVVVAAAAVLAGGLVTTPAPSLATRPSPSPYVALGDSYSSAAGVQPTDPTAPPSCDRSLRNYPHVIAARTGKGLTDVTCSGAKTKDFFESQSPGVPPQLDALSRSTKLVTMTIGGNDSNVFGNSIVQCGSAAATTAGRGSPCKDRYGSSFEDTVRTTTYPALVRALRAVRAKAPNARVAILGYPWIVPRSRGCYPILPIATGDVPYLRSLQATLNDAVRRAAAATRFDLRRPEPGFAGARRLQADRHPVDRAGRGQYQPGGRAPQRARRERMARHTEVRLGL